MRTASRELSHIEIECPLCDNLIFLDVKANAIGKKAEDAFVKMYMEVTNRHDHLHPLLVTR